MTETDLNPRTENAMDENVRAPERFEEINASCNRNADEAAVKDFEIDEMNSMVNPSSEAGRLEENELHQEICQSSIRNEEAPKREKIVDRNPESEKMDTLLDGSSEEIPRSCIGDEYAETQTILEKNPDALLDGLSEEIQQSSIKNEQAPKRGKIVNTNPESEKIDELLDGSSEEIPRSCIGGNEYSEKESILETNPDALLHGPSEEIQHSCTGNEPVSDAVEREKIMDTVIDRSGRESSAEDLSESLVDKDDSQSSSDSNNIEVELPEDLRKGVLELSCESFASLNGYCRVYLVGTAHVSRESCRQVEAAIRHLKPEVVFLELCESRSSILMPQSLKVPSYKDMMEMWRTKQMNIFGILYSWFLAKVADRLEVFPGSEFRVAYEEAIACGAKIILGDRHVQITLKRTWAKMSPWYKIKLVLSMVSQALFLPSIEELSQMMQEMDNMDMVTLLIQEMSKSFPSLLETLVHERDMYMSAMLHRIAEHHSLVVAVVGKGHLSGIAKNWKENISVKALLEVPERKAWYSTSFKRLSAMALVVGALAVASGFYLFNREE